MHINSTDQPDFWGNLVEKFCPTCKKNKPLNKFPKCKGRSYGRGSRCSECQNIKVKEYKEKNREKVNERGRKYAKEARKIGKNKYHNAYRKYHLKKLYGLTPETYKEMLTSQQGVCALCKRSSEESSKREMNLAVDHCHETKVVRGLLCPDCNRGLGLFKDNPDLLRAAADYLERHMK